MSSSLPDFNPANVLKRMAWIAVGAVPIIITFLVLQYFSLSSVQVLILRDLETQKLHAHKNISEALVRLEVNQQHIMTSIEKLDYSRGERAGSQLRLSAFDEAFAPVYGKYGGH